MPIAKPPVSVASMQKITNVPDSQQEIENTLVKRIKKEVRTLSSHEHSPLKVSCIEDINHFPSKNKRLKKTLRYCGHF